MKDNRNQKLSHEDEWENWINRGATSEQRKSRFNIVYTARRLVVATFVIGIIVTFIVVGVSYFQFRKVITDQYKSMLMKAARAALVAIDTDNIQKYIETKKRDANYYKTYASIQRLVSDFNLDYVYVCTVDFPDYTTMHYIYDVVTLGGGFRANKFGTMQEVDTKDFPPVAKKILENGDSAVRFVLHSVKTPAHITANVPVRNSSGDIIALLGVRSPMQEFITASTRYFIEIDVAVLFGTLAFIMMIIFMFKKMLVEPVAIHNVKMRIYLDEARNATRAKGQFLATMSHEIRTPMNAILGFSEIAMRDALPPATAGYLEKINRASRSLLAIINDILDYSKIEAGKMDIIPADYNLATLLDDVSSIMKMRIASKSINFVVDKADDVPINLFGDDVRLKQVLINIAGNATKFTEEGEIRITVRLGDDSPSATKIGDPLRISFSIKDTGIGIKKEDLSKLFTSFQQVNMAQNRLKEGTGLGLAISKQLVNLMGGTLQVKSEYGKGSDFFFTIDQKIGKEKSAEDKVERFVCPECNILVVDDNEVNLLVAQGFLAPYKCSVATASSGQDAIDIVQKSNGQSKRFQIIFMDHMMPEMDGEEAMHRIRQNDKASNTYHPIIALTANVISGAHDKFVGLGFDDYLAKPLEAKDLDRVMKKYIPANMQSSVGEDNSFVDAANFTADGTILKTFYKQIDQKVALITDCAEKIAKGDAMALKSYQIEVHALKSSAKVCGFSDVSLLAKLAEQAAINKDTAYIQKETGELLKNYKALKEVIEKKLGSENQEDKATLPKEPISLEQLNNAKQQVLQSIENCDIDMLGQNIASLRQKELPQKWNTALKELQEAADDIDFDRAGQIVAKI